MKKDLSAVWIVLIAALFIGSIVYSTISKANNKKAEKIMDIEIASDLSFDRGYNSGYEDGRADGYSKGYEEGYEAGMDFAIETVEDWYYP